MRTRKLELKALKARNGSGLYAKGKKQRNAGNDNGNKRSNNDQQGTDEKSKDTKPQKETRNFFHCGKVDHF